MLDRFRRKPPPAAPAPPSPQEVRITNGLASLRDATVRDVMTPRVDVDALPAPVRFADAAQAVRRSGHSHFPVFEQDLDRLLGVLFVKDLFHLEGAANDGPGTGGGIGPGETVVPVTLDVTNRVREPYVVPESRSALEVLSDMRVRRRGFAVVVDEHGGFAGVLTIKDLVSELVGDLRDEFDRSASPAIVRIDANRFLVDGSCAVNDVREATGADLPDGEYVTLGGFILDALGHIPTEGETLRFGESSYRVARMERRRVAKVVVEARAVAVATDERRGAEGQ